MIPIPNKHWGAVEKIIWAYKLGLEKLGHTVDVKYLNELDGSSDIVHTHIANLALECLDKGIPYVFSVHDHHTVYYGKGSTCYQNTLNAIKGSICSFCHAEFLVEYFDETDKLFFLSHGVDNAFFSAPDRKFDNVKHKLLMLANNGLAGDSGFDRKGFGYGIEAARILKLPITIVGTDSNVEFFRQNRNLYYERSNLILNNPPDEKVRELHREHTIFLHPSMLEAGHPNLTILEALSSGLPVVGTYKGEQKIESMVIVERDNEQVAEAIQKVIDNYETYSKQAVEDAKKFSWDLITKRLSNIYEVILEQHNLSSSFKVRSQLLAEITGEPEAEPVFEPETKINFAAINGTGVDIIGSPEKNFLVHLFSGDEKFYECALKGDMWCKHNTQYFIQNLRCVVEDTDKNECIFSGKLPLNRVYIHLDSKSIGDTLAWIPYCQAFKDKHQCEVIVSTFHNDLFDYPELRFVKPASVVDNINAMYQIGWFYDTCKEPEYPITIPLQKAATNILGLEYKELKPKMLFSKEEANPFPSKKYVTIATSSTAQCKEWDNEKWLEVVTHLKSQGYDVVNCSLNPCNIAGVIEPKQKGLKYIMNVLHHSQYFIGLSSGISWLAWAMDKEVFMIANFSKEWHEFSCHRITNTLVCNGCWNNEMFKFNAGDWAWCPMHKGKPRAFECHKVISAKDVIKKISVLHTT